jgi:hypothetical protein
MVDRWKDFRSPLTLSDWHNVERRIGRRVPTTGVEVRWMPPAEVIDLRDEGFLGRVVEVSVTGAAIDASSSLGLEVPSQARLRYADGETTVTIRHATPTEQAGVTRFGVEWSSLAEPLRSVVYELVEGAPSSSAS